ncbi:uncharacterized protein LOC114362938 [Ostrinia furnacalis]|uniref:uncharacterized protein LOC114362938 n=1 Tax=Ostrinia furnacalis TaxID=93504 RepID=UPI00103FAB06|nr:uncharacterized protein LOC114362938 [Ostrinia furnacalis]
MCYENKQLVILFEQSFTNEDEQLSSDEEEKVDHISQRSLESDTEQELSDNEEQEAIPTSNQPFYTGKDGVTIWSSQPSRSTAKSENISLKPGVKPVARNAKTEMECWKHFISDNMLEQILCHTNALIKQRQLAVSKKSCDSFMKETTIDELLALFGLMYLAGLNRSNRQNLNDLWRTDGTGVEIFRNTMSVQRFHFLHSRLRFDDAETRRKRKTVDNLAPIRSIFEEFVTNCDNAYAPSKYLTIDEKLEAFRGRCPFRQHIPKKPAKYGIKINEAFDIVDRLVQPISNSYRNVTFDNWFTSIPLMTHLQQNHKLTATGSLRKDKREIPTSFVTARRKEVYSSQFAFQNDMTLVSYVPKKSKVILVLSSLHHKPSIDPASGDKQKPEIVTFYDSTKNCVDTVDQICAAYDVSRASKRWPMTVFYAVMNIAAVNSEIIFRENNKFTSNRRDFIRKLGLTMLEGYLHMRKDMKLPTNLRKRIHEQIGETMSYPTTSKTLRKRCKDCPNSKDKKTRHYSSSEVLTGLLGLRQEEVACLACLVCGDDVSGIHYGALTCESCKWFFKSTVQLDKQDNYNCKQSRLNCEITVYSRSWCKRCRYNKCLSMGMRPQLVTKKENIETIENLAGPSIRPITNFWPEKKSREFTNDCST